MEIQEKERSDVVQPRLRPCEHQVAGHLFEEGKAGSLVDDLGHFYKPIQPGPRGDREKAFYLEIQREKERDVEDYRKGTWTKEYLKALKFLIHSGSLVEALLDVIEHEECDGGGELKREETKREGVDLVRMPTFHLAPSMPIEFIRQPIEVMERDEFGLIDGLNHVDDEDIEWSDDDTHGSKDGGGGSPESDSGYNMTTGERMMADIKNAFDNKSRSIPEGVESLKMLQRSGSPSDVLANKSESSETLRDEHHDACSGNGIRHHETDDNELVASMSGIDLERSDKVDAEVSAIKLQRVMGLLPFSVRNAPLLRVIPKFYGIQTQDDRVLLELEDLARHYTHPCIIDIKIGRRTWYAGADEAYILRCQKKDSSTTQASLGFKICGMQVYRHGRGGYWRASKRWCKTLPEPLVDQALTSFVHNENGLRPVDVYGGTNGVVHQLSLLEEWFRLQTEFKFFSSSVLILYEGNASSESQTNVKVRLVDFAHTFREPEQALKEESGIDTNFVEGIGALKSRLLHVCETTFC